MKINNKMLSIPPHISTSWSNVAALHMRDNNLIVGLYDGESISIPNLTPETIELSFQCHAAFLELFEVSSNDFPPEKFPTSLSQAILQSQTEGHESPFRIGFSSIDELGSAMHHNPQQASAPELPPEILKKIAAITQIIAPEDPQALPKPEPHCNCMHCQIARAVQNGLHTQETELKVIPEEVVKPEELTFQQWEIQQNGNNLFTVVNRLDTQEEYHVFLGQPVGCTCGCQNCEHIIAVLKS